MPPTTHSTPALSCVVLTGGGTGGHIFPAVAIGRAMARAYPACRIHYVGRADGMEAAIVAREPWTFHALPARPFKRLGWWRKLQAIGVAVPACVAAWRLCRQLRPTCVIGTGGYVTGPLLFIASLLRIPTVIHEQNSVPGLTNRWLGRCVDRVCITFAESERYFPRRKVLMTGMPIRDTVAGVQSMHAGSAPTLLVMGGSQGAHRVNELVVAMLPRLQAAVPAVQVIHQTGRQADLDAIRRAYQAAGIAAEVVPFIEQMESVYPCVHLAISRAGSGSLAELAAVGIPAILIPFPFAADNHQEMNARELVAQGGAVLIREQDATPQRLADECVQLLQRADRLRQMRHAMQQVARPAAAQAVVAACEALVWSADV